MSGRRAAVIVGSAGLVFSLAVLALPTFPLAVRSPMLHVALEMTGGWVALTAALLLSGRLRRGGRLPDLLLVVALSMSGLTNVLLSAGGAIATGQTSDALVMWGALVGRTVTALLFAGAALSPDRALPGRGWALRAWVTALLAVVSTGVVVHLVGGRLPAGVGVAVAGVVTSGEVSSVATHPTVDAAQLLMAAAYGAAAIGFGRRSRLSGDPMLPWLVSAGLIAMLARLHYFLFPSLYAEVVYSGDLLRLCFHLLLLGAAMAELRATWRALAAGAAAEERRRIARDLHDGLAQELAFVTTQARWVTAAYPDDQRAALLASGAQRALDESRRAIETLASTGADTLADAVHRAVEDVAARFQHQVAIEIDDTVDAAPEVREQLVRIVREAVANALRHGSPASVVVRVQRNAGHIVLDVEDDGVGFDPDAAERHGLRFGLRSMRERTETLGGAFTITSDPGSGAHVRVELPWMS